MSNDRHFWRLKESKKRATFDYISPAIPEHVINSSRTDFISWYISRYRLTVDDANINLPSCPAIKTLLSSAEIILTLRAFTPIMPHPETQFDTIFTYMKNFYALLQKNIPYGRLWSDEGVYKIAKEKQLLRPQEIDSIFLGFRGFHMEKVALACLGSFLKESGTKNEICWNRRIWNSCHWQCSGWRALRICKAR